MTDKLLSVEQKVLLAEPGTQLVDIVDFTVFLEGDTVLTGNAPLGNYVDLFDIQTGKVVVSHYYYPTLVSQTLSDSLPLQGDAAVLMPTNPFYLQLRVSRGVFVSDVPTYIVDDTKTLEPIWIPGSTPPPPVVSAGLVGLAVAAVGFSAAGIYLLTRRKK